LREDLQWARVMKILARILKILLNILKIFDQDPGFSIGFEIAI